MSYTEEKISSKTNQKEAPENMIHRAKGLDDISIIDIILVLWKGRYAVISCTVIMTVLGILYALNAPEVFTTSSYFFIKNGKGSGTENLSQLASLAGFSLRSSENIDPSIYIDQIIKDREFAERLYNRKWFFKGDSLNLEQILKVKKDTTLENWQHIYYMAKIEAIRDDDLLSIKKDAKTGVLTLISNISDPQLTYDLNKYTLDFISNYIRNSIQTQAKEKRLFIQERLKEVKDDLQIYENKLINFRERNLMSKSPQLLMEEARLSRQVTLDQEIYLQFQKQYELVKLEELDNQTLLQIVRNPDIPAIKSKPKRKVIIAISLLFGLCLGLCSAIGIHVFPKLIILLKKEPNRSFPNNLLV